MAPAAQNGNGKKLASWLNIIIPTCALLIAGGVGYGALSSEVGDHHTKIEKLETTIADELAEIHDRLMRIETLLERP